MKAKISRLTSSGFSCCVQWEHRWMWRGEGRGSIAASARPALYPERAKAELSPVE
jgi:hypothetical protein